VSCVTNTSFTQPMIVDLFLFNMCVPSSAKPRFLFVRARFLSCVRVNKHLTTHSVRV